MKTYCKNCKHRGARYGSNWRWCESIKAKTEENNTRKKQDKNYAINLEADIYTGTTNELRIESIAIYKKELNLTGECIYFEPSILFKIKKFIYNLLKN